MDYSSAQNQVMQVEQQSQTLIEHIQTVAQKLKAAAPGDATGREWAMDLREIAISVQSENQMLATLVTQMGQYIQTLEAQLQTHPNPTVQPRGWASSGGGGFLGSLTAGLGMGAGFGLAEDAINGIFNAL
ncbi:MAG TPA: hypothetical protein VKT00_08705 [Casimicrobiaceae bacterium]|nr:hypothetical protein [Casimicrobiaceae bacterium]